MNDSNLPQELPPIKSKLAFLTGEELLELKGVSPVEDVLIRSELHFADDAYDYFAISAAIPKLGNTGSDPEEERKIAEIMIGILKAVVAEGRIMKPLAIKEVAGRIFAIYAFDPRKIEAPQLLIIRRALAEKITTAVDDYSKELEAALKARKGPQRQGPRPMFG